jgi:hypothetical protein
MNTAPYGILSTNLTEAFNDKARPESKAHFSKTVKIERLCPTQNDSTQIPPPRSHNPFSQSNVSGEHRTHARIYLSLSPNADIPLNSISSPPINTTRANPPAIKSIKEVVSIILVALCD